MAITIMCLKDGQLTTASKAEVYKAPDTKAAIVKNIRVANIDTVARTFNLYYLKTAANYATESRLISAANTSLAPGQIVVFDQELTLAPTESVRGDASVGAKLDFVISGIERDV